VSLPVADVRAGSLPTAPPYGRGTLADLVPAVLAALGVPGEPDAFGLPPAPAACILLVDGLGADLLGRHADAAPTLSHLAAGGRRFRVGFPSTTAASLASLGTGLPPGAHGVLGYEVAVPGQDRLLNALRWDAAVDPQAWQPRTTAFERAVRAGVTVRRVAHSSLARTGLTAAGLRGGEAYDADSAGELVAAVATALAGRRPALVYAYYGDLDGTGHRAGVASPAWRAQLRHVDLLVRQLVDALPTDAVLYVTADHGMVDVPAHHRVDLAAAPELRAGVRLLGGEPRARYVYTRPGAAGDVGAAWREVLGDRFWVLSRAEAVAAGLFGAVTEELTPRIGEILAVAREPWIVVDSAREAPALLRLVGWHGALSPAEMDVPLLRATAGG
jgi:Type I phosphodiesterase / nucleotide pyrophosphatase